jgi:hypothetical protein
VALTAKAAIVDGAHKGVDDDHGLFLACWLAGRIARSPNDAVIMPEEADWLVAESSNDL